MLCRNLFSVWNENNGSRRIPIAIVVATQQASRIIEKRKCILNMSNLGYGVVS